MSDNNDEERRGTRVVNEDTPYYLGVLIANEQHDTIRSVLMALGVLNKLNRFMSRYMTTTKDRMRSFRNCMIQLKKKPELYCEAGFMYSGNGENDVMTCFFCSIGIYKWDKDDDPWVEHIRWSPKCKFVWLSKGNIYSRQVSNMIHSTPIMNKQDVLALASNLIDPKIIEKKYNIRLTQSHMDPPEPIPECALGQILFQLILKLNYKAKMKEIPGKVICKICFQEEVEVAFIPCGHMVSCTSCAITFDLCPICKRAYNDAFRVFIMYGNNENLTKNEELAKDKEAFKDEEEANDLCPVCERPSNEAVRMFIRNGSKINLIKNEEPAKDKKAAKDEKPDRDEEQANDEEQPNDEDQANDEEQPNDEDQANDEDEANEEELINDDENPTGYEESAEDKIMFEKEKLVRDEESANDVEQHPSSMPPRAFMACNICNIRKMGIAFMPCGHVYTCIECAPKIMRKCLVCSEECFAQMHVYF